METAARTPGAKQKPWHGFLLCLAAGGISALSMAPYNIWLLLFPGLSALYYTLSRAPATGWAFLYGYAFSFGYFFFSLLWIGNALLIEGNPYVWAWPLAVAGLPLILSLFPATGCWLAWRLSPLDRVSGFFFFAAALAMAEWLRGTLFTGFPWNLYGYAWIDLLPVVQMTALGNIYLLTWLTILWAALPGFLLRSTLPRRQRYGLALFLVLVFAAVYGFGAWRLASAPTTYHDHLAVRLVQPNIPQSEKWNRAKMQSHLERHLLLSENDGSEQRETIVIWPETAISYWQLQDPLTQHMIGAVLKSYGGKASLLTGFLRYDKAAQAYYNSLILLNSDGGLVNTYDKHHLVPFGEYIPYQKWIPLKPVVEFSGFKEGSGLTAVSLNDAVKYSPVICYEIIFSGQVTPRAARPDFIVNVTNDAWYGQSAGPYQHFVQARLRAVEEGLPVVRVANTGISGVIDPLGRIIEKSPLLEQYEKTVALPKANMLILKTEYSEIILFLLFLFPALFFPLIKKLI